MKRTIKEEKVNLSEYIGNKKAFKLNANCPLANSRAI